MKQTKGISHELIIEIDCEIKNLSKKISNFIVNLEYQGRVKNSHNYLKDLDYSCKVLKIAAHRLTRVIDIDIDNILNIN